MRFKQHIAEEYFAREDESEIFKNPDTSETRKLFNIHGNLRVLIDFSDKTIFIFTFEFLHKMAATTLAKEDVEGTFDAFEIIRALHGDGKELVVEPHQYVIQKGKVIRKDGHKTSSNDIQWVKDKFKCLGQIEDYKPGW